MVAILHHPIRGVMSRVLTGVTASAPTDTSDTNPGAGGSFSNAFSAAFDLGLARFQFNSAFDSSFAIFSRNKEFSTAFSDAFTNENI